MISNNAYYELFASYTVPDHNRVGYWVDLGANSKGKVIKTYNENLKKWVKVTDATSEDAVAPFIGNNGNWWIDNRDTGINASGHSPYIGDNSNWFIYSSERNEHIDTGLPSRGEAGPKGDKGDKGKDATINGVGSIKIEAGDNITITQSDDTLTIIGDVQKPDLSNYATKTEVTKLDNKLQDAVSSVFRAKGSVKTYNNLPVDKVSIGDVYNVLDTGANYVAISINPITWDKLSETVDLSKFFNKNEINSLLSTKVDKQEGKQLTTEDFTTVLKRKLEGLSNYNDTEIRNAIDSLESAFNTLVEGNATVAIDTFNEIVDFLKNVENSQDLDSIIAGINTTISKVEAKIPDTNNFLSKDGGTMNNTNLVGNLNAELLNGYSSDKFVNIHNLINGTATDATTVGLNTINQDYLWTNTPYSDIATLVDISYSPDWRSLFFISPSTKRIHTSFKYNGDSWSNWKEIAFTDGTIANSLKLNGISSGYDSLNGFIPVVGIGREMEIGSYLDFHLKGGEEKDYSTRLVCSGNTMNEVNLPLSNGTLALLSDTVAAANKLSTTRYLWGQPFDGSGNVKGIIRGVQYVSFETYDYEGGSAGYVGRGGTNSNDLSITTYGENYIEFSTKSTERMRITKDGLVGINTTTPRGTLDVNGSSVIDGYVYLKGVNRRIYFYNSEGEGLLIDNNGINWHNTNDSFAFNIMTFSSNKMVGIGTTTPQEALDVNGNIRVTGYARLTGNVFINSGTSSDNNQNAGKLFFGGSNSENHGVYLSATKSDTYGRKRFGIFTTNAASDTPRWVESFSITPNGKVGINTTKPRGTLDVNGTTTFHDHLYLFNDKYIFINANSEGLYIKKNGLYWHNSDNAYVRGLIEFNDIGDASFGRVINMGGSDQINGTLHGIALNYNCGKYVDTSIWDGQYNIIMRVFGEGRGVAIGPSAIESPQGRLNVDGDVVFENARFITTSGFTDGAYAYNHAIYCGYHGINVCEFYESEFKFKTNGGDITSFTLNRYYADFNGTVRTYNCNFIGVWNGVNRFKLARDGESNTWLQAGTDTTEGNGNLYMSGLNGALLHQFNVWASVSNFKGSIIAEGDVTAYSDIRLKNRIESVNNVLDTINTLDVFRYTWKNREDKSVHIGVSAQQVQAIYPEFVLTSDTEDGTDYLTVNYAALATCIAIQGIKELAKKGDERDKRIAALEEEVISLKEQLRYGNK